MMETATASQDTLLERSHILVVDDDDRLRSLLKKFLYEQGYAVTVAADATEARALLGWFIFDLMILDVMMPGETGLALLNSLQETERPPVLMLSAMSEAEDRINGLEHGAEDYLVKPFEPRELLLRIHTILRRRQRLQESQRIVAFGDYRFDMISAQLKRGEDIIYLTTSEAALLKCLAAEIGKPVSREALTQALPGIGNERTVDVQITRLRKKIEESEGKPLYLQTVRGAGYMLHG